MVIWALAFDSFFFFLRWLILRVDQGVPDEAFFLSVCGGHWPLNQWSHSSTWVSNTQSAEGLNRARGRGKRNWPLFLLSHCLNWDIHLLFSCFQTGMYIIGSSGSEAFEPELSYTTGFPGSPITDSRLWDFTASTIMWASTSQYTSFYIMFCFSGEPWLIHVLSIPNST